MPVFFIKLALELLMMIVDSICLMMGIVMMVDNEMLKSVEDAKKRWKEDICFCRVGATKATVLAVFVVETV